MAPQHKDLSRKLWVRIERLVRGLADRDGEVWIVTGLIFQGVHIQALNERVLVPSATLKAVYDPKRQLARAYVTPNDDSDQWETISLAELRERSGIEVFPSLSDAVKARKSRLPSPASRQSAGTPPHAAIDLGHLLLARNTPSPSSQPPRCLAGGVAAGGRRAAGPGSPCPARSHAAAV
jgi:endonuclease G